MVKCGIAVKTVSSPGITERRTFRQECDGNREACQEAEDSKDINRDPEPIFDSCEGSFVEAKDRYLSQHDRNEKIWSRPQDSLFQDKVIIISQYPIMKETQL